MFCFVFFLTGCASLKTIDAEIGKFLNGEKVQENEIVVEQKVDEQSSSTLLKEQKEKIDLWLMTNGYNRYGDILDTYYSGGTPLFDELSGEMKERYEYILEKHPDILSKI
jgi:hypothetical protein